MANTFGEVSWDDDSSNKTEKKTQGGKDDWLRLKEGSNVIRLVTKPHQYIVHKAVKKESDKKGFGQKVNCSNPDGKGECELCTMGHKPGRRWFLGVLDIASNSYKILDISWQVFSGIQKLAKETDVWGDPSKYNINIVVDKNGGPTGYYTVQPQPHKPLSPEQLKVVAAADLDDLKRRVVPPTPEQVKGRVAKILEGEKVSMPPAKESKFPAKVASSGSTASVVTEEDESIDDVFPSYDAQ